MYMHDFCTHTGGTGSITCRATCMCYASCIYIVHACADSSASVMCIVQIQRCTGAYEAHFEQYVKKYYVLCTLYIVHIDCMMQGVHCAQRTAHSAHCAQREESDCGSGRAEQSTGLLFWLFGLVHIVHRTSYYVHTCTCMGRIALHAWTDEEE